MRASKPFAHPNGFTWRSAFPRTVALQSPSNASLHSTSPGPVGADAEGDPRTPLTRPTSARSAAPVGFFEPSGTRSRFAGRTVPGVGIQAVFSYSARPGGASRRARSSWLASAPGSRAGGACGVAPGPVRLGIAMYRTLIGATR